MAVHYADRVAETTDTTGTGAYSLNGAKAGFQGFVAGAGGGNTCSYCATDGADWEVGLGTVADANPDTLSRDTILASSNGGAAVDWPAGTKDVFLTAAASEILFVERADEQTMTGGGTPGSVAMLGFDRNFAGIDPKLRLRNAEQGQYGSAIEFYKVDALGAVQPAARIIGERWAGSPDYGQLRLQVGSFGGWGETVTFDANGKLSAKNIIGSPTIVAEGGAAVTGLHSQADATPPGVGVIRHGWWGIGTTTLVGRGGGSDVMTLDWQQRVGIGYAPAVTPATPAKFGVKNHLDTIPVAVFEAVAAQSANIVECLDSAGNVLTTVSENGYWTTRKTAAPADGELVAGELALWLDATNGSPKLKATAKQADGTVQSGEVSLHEFIAPVLSATVISAGDLVWRDTDGTVKPASDFPWTIALEDTQAAFAALFLGVALEASASGETAPIKVSTSPLVVHQFAVVSGTYLLGDDLGPDESPASTLSNTVLEPVGSSGLAIARTVEFAAEAVTSLRVTFGSAFHTASANANAAIG